MDAAGEMVGMIGHCYIAGRPASKTISAAGGGSVSFRTGTCTFTDVGTSVTVSIEDVGTTTGNPGRPDESPDVASAALLGNGGGITSAAWNTVSMTGGSGSKTIAHGDLIAIRWDMTARAATDSVIIATQAISVLAGSTTNPQRPQVLTKLAGTWADADLNPNVVITFDDGTLGILDYCIPLTSGGTEAYADSDNPDERGMIFQVPWDCKVDGFWGHIGIASGTTSDYTVTLYSDPLAAGAGPTAISGAQVVVLAEQLGPVNSPRAVFMTLPAEISLTKNTDYCLAVRANGAGNVQVSTGTLGNTAYRTFFGKGTSLRKGTRQNGAGAFAEEGTPVTVYQLGVRISSFDDGTPTGSRARIASGF